MTGNVIDEIHRLLDEASKLADKEAISETFRDDPFTFLQQLIDYALAKAENMMEPKPL